MSISSRLSVASHILSLVAISQPDECTSEYIAGSVNTNPVVIRRLTGMLRNAGLLHVRPGIGGASLAKELEQITLLDVYRAVESIGEGELFHIHDKPNPQCAVGARIQDVLDMVLTRAQAAMESVLGSITMAEIVSAMNLKKG